MPTRFIETKTGQCMFFLPGESGPDGLVCGEPTTGGKSFCDCHRKITHQKLKPFREPPGVRMRAAGEWAASEREPDLTEIIQ